MTRILRSAGLALALATAGLCFSASTSTPGGATAAPTGGFTPLPAGWELCVLQGLSAPVTPANVDDLDEWQSAEGGSTNNTAAYDPFNTRRITDVLGAPLAEVMSANGFPAFATWSEGCAATVATLFQPNMWPITAALRAGNVVPAGAFLAVVDQSAWCAPSSDGTPCYASKVLGAAASLPEFVAHSAALDVFGNVKADLSSFQKDLTAVTADQGMLTARDQQLVAAESQVSSAQAKLAVADQTLRRFAIDEYVSSGLYANDWIADPAGRGSHAGAQSEDALVARQYASITAGDLLSRQEAAVAAVKASLAGRADAAKAAAQAASTLASDEAAEHGALLQMVADVATMQTAGACTTVTIAVPEPNAPAAGGSTNTTTGSTTTVPTTVPPTTTTTVPLATTTVPTTTTTTVPPSTTTTLPSLPASVVATTTTTTTVPLATTTIPTTTTTVPTTTTTVRSPTAATPPTGSPQNGIPAGVAALQGCVAALAPAGSQ